MLQPQTISIHLESIMYVQLPIKMTWDFIGLCTSVIIGKKQNKVDEVRNKPTEIIMKAVVEG